MSRESAEMFSFADGGFEGVALAGDSGPVARMAGESFVSSMDVTSASADATNSLPSIAAEGLGIA